MLNQPTLKVKDPKTVITFISGSAGELDWVLPILDLLLNEGFNIKVVFLKKHAKRSVENNRMLYDYIFRGNSRIEVVSCGGYFFEKIEHIGYLSYRIFLKLNLDKNPVSNQFFKLIDKLSEIVFFRGLSSAILDLKNQKNIFISEFPSLRRPRDTWIKRKFIKSIFFYCPHSPHVYTEDLDKKYPEPDNGDFSNKRFLLLGHPGDYFVFNDGKEMAASNLIKVFVGHPKYSNVWLRDLQKKATDFRYKSSNKKETNILIISRGFGSYLDEKSHIKLVETTIGVIEKHISNYNLFVKKHPREINSQWDKIADNYSSVTIVNDHILDIAVKVNFAISFWSSGAMDCFFLGVPVVEFFDPNKHSKSQVADGNFYTTIYRKLGIVLSANNQFEFEEKISELVSSNFKMQVDEIHPFFDELIIRTNAWDKVIKDILLSHKLLDN